MLRRSLLSLAILFSIIQPSIEVYWYMEPCRLTTDPDGTLTLCEQKADCATEVSGSTVDCSQYTYVTVSVVSQCISTCCYQLSPVPTTLSGALVQQCYHQSELRRILYVVKIVFIVTGIVGLFVGAIACYVCAFTKNPYTGQRVYVGCCCCKKVPDFQKYRQEQLQSMQKIGQAKSKNVMDLNEKKVSKISIH